MGKTHNAYCHYPTFEQKKKFKKKQTQDVKEIQRKKKKDLKKKRMFFSCAKYCYGRILTHRMFGVSSGLLATSWFWKKAESEESKKKTKQREAYEKAARIQFYTAAHSPLPSGWSGPVFRPNFNFAKKRNDEDWLNKDTHPWLKINFKTHPEQYLRAVLDYCYKDNINEYNVEQSFDMTSSKVWVVAPHQHFTGVGREPIHGLTVERPSPRQWLADTQLRETQTMAIGFYNEPGGYIFGQVWADPAEPNYYGPNDRGISFPEGTVSFKLLFTQCTEQEAPYLKGAPMFHAMVPSYIAQPADPDPERVLDTVRLLQVDVAVKDSRFDNPTGWIFGSFTYDSSVQEQNPWRRLIPIGLQWGNDPDRTLKDKDLPLKEGWLNEVAKNRIVTKARPQVGFANRINGPLDTFASACAACHMTAQMGIVGSLVPNMPKNPETDDLGNSERRYFFKNLKCGDVFDENMNFYKPVSPPQHVHSLDYSLQLQMGLANFFVWRRGAFPDIGETHIHALKVPGVIIPSHKNAHLESVNGKIHAQHSQS